jgi:hypothetical protein
MLNWKHQKPSTCLPPACRTGKNRQASGRSKQFRRGEYGYP